VTCLDGTEAGVARYTRRVLSDVFLGESAASQLGRSPTELTISGLAGCTRAAALAVADIEATNIREPEEARESVLGQVIHGLTLPAMAEIIGGDAVYEAPVVLRAAGLTIRGTLDLAASVVGGAPLNAVWDVKTVKEWRLAGVRRIGGAYTAHWLQVMFYAWARYQAGHDVDWVVWIYIDRSTGQEDIRVSRFSPYALNAVLNRMREIAYWAERPDDAPREVATLPSTSSRRREYAGMSGPGLSIACDQCPWLARCWPGATSGSVGAQRVLAASPAGVEQALRLYAEAAEQESLAKSDKKFAKAILDGTPDGTYGPFRLGHRAPGSSLNTAAIEALYSSLGLEVPKIRNEPAISVTYAPRHED
jgi:hypothetical protein